MEQLKHPVPSQNPPLCPLSLKVELKLTDSLGAWGVGSGTELSLPISLLSET